MRILLTLAALLALGCDRLVDTPSAGIDQVEYDVISAAISHTLQSEPYAGTPHSEDEQQPIERIVIAEKPNAEVPPTLGRIPTDDGIPPDPATLSSYAAKTSQTRFERRFTGIGDYELFSDAVRSELFAPASWNWSRFYERYPGAPGLFVFSRVGLNADQTEAALFVMHIRGGTWGHEGSMLFRKRDGRWSFAGSELWGQY